MNGRSRLLPHPVLSASLLVVWLLLVNSVAPGQAVLGAVLAVAIPRFTAPFWTEAARIRRPGLLVRFFLLVLWDIVLANLTVARLILGPRARLRPRFVRVPLALRNPAAITMLAGVITMTPGTVSAELSEDRKTLLVHGLDVSDAEQLVAQIKARYEAPIKEIFE